MFSSDNNETQNAAEHITAGFILSVFLLRYKTRQKVNRSDSFTASYNATFGVVTANETWESAQMRKRMALLWNALTSLLLCC